MLLGKKRRIGRRIEEMKEGEKLTLTEKMEDKDLLLYLGLTNDSNPLYIQHDYASQTPFKKPIVPPAMLTGIMTSAISKYLPGPGSHITKQNFEFLLPIYHYETVQFLFEIIEIDRENHTVTIQVAVTNEDDELMAQGRMAVVPPHELEFFQSSVLDNF